MFAKTTAQKMARRFGGSVTVSNEILSSYRYSVSLSIRSTQVVVDVAHRKVRVSILNYQSPNEIVFSIGKPADPSFTLLAGCKQIYPRCQVFGVASPTSFEIALIEDFISEKTNKNDITALTLTSEECLAVYSNCIESTLRLGKIDSLFERIEVIIHLSERNNQLVSAKTIKDERFQMVLSNAIDQNLPSRDIGPIHSFRGTYESGIPICRNCHRPFQLLVTVDFADPILEIKRGGFFRVFVCLSCDSYRDPLFLQFHGNRVELLQQSLGESFGDIQRSSQQRRMKLLIPMGDHSLETDIGSHWFGGSPVWIQSPLHAKCVRCERNMTFVLQIGSDDELDFQFGDDGVLYVFLCEHCNITAAIVQSH